MDNFDNAVIPQLHYRAFSLAQPSLSVFEAAVLAAALLKLHSDILSATDMVSQTISVVDKFV